MDPNTFPARSGLINDVLEGQLKTLLAKLTAPVAFTCIVDDGEKSTEMAALVNHIASLSDQLSVRFLAPGDDPALDNALDASLLPATAVGSQRMVFHGVPGGKEITAFASAILTAGNAAKALDKYTLKDIAKIAKPMTLQLCVSLGCAHCSQLVAAAHRIAWENTNVTAHMIDANLYPELVQKLNIQRVPLTVINGKDAFPGGKTMAELTTLLAKYKG
ncbi:MAG: thioredoxin family protein [Oscillospiraceae bacterium]|nr:thioredoxin family protein [Oscillospiraceae bacterium]MBQ8239161.1 thioredoxin family protein [Oscillospiraceae bacterium]